MPFDLDAVIAEAKPAPKKSQFTFTFDGEEYSFLTPSDPMQFDAIASRAAAEGDNVAALRRLMSSAEYGRLSRSPKTLTQESLLALLDAYYKHLVGMTTGESVASSSSSTSTARPSKRTSTGTTRRARSKR